MTRPRSGTTPVASGPERPAAPASAQAPTATAGGERKLPTAELHPPLDTPARARGSMPRCAPHPIPNPLESP